MQLAGDAAGEGRRMDDPVICQLMKTTKERKVEPGAATRQG